MRGVEYFSRTTKEANLQARQMFEEALALDPQYAEAHVWLGVTYYLEWIWRWNQDVQTLEQALMIAQRAVVLNDSLPGAHGLLGMIYAQKKLYDQAIAEGERAVALDPNDAASYVVQAEALNVMGRPEEALRAVEQAIRLNPRAHGGQLINLGSAYYLTGRYTEAVTTLKSLLIRNPNWLSAYFILSASYMSQWAFQLSQDPQTLAQALAAAQRTLALNDSSPQGHAFLGFVYLWQKQYEPAIAEGERAIVLDPNNAMPYAILAETLSRVGRSDDSLRMVEQASHRKPTVVDQHLNPVGSAYYFAGRPAEAIAPLKHFLARYPNVLGAHLTLAAVYSELGKEAEARTEVAEVLRINPQFSLKVHKERVPIKDSATLERHIAALRKAGLK